MDWIVQLCHFVFLPIARNPIIIRIDSSYHLLVHVHINDYNKFKSSLHVLDSLYKGAVPAAFQAAREAAAWRERRGSWRRAAARDAGALAARQARSWNPSRTWRQGEGMRHRRRTRGRRRVRRRAGGAAARRVRSARRAAARHCPVLVREARRVAEVALSSEKSPLRVVRGTHSGWGWARARPQSALDSARPSLQHSSLAKSTVDRKKGDILEV